MTDSDLLSLARPTAAVADTETVQLSMFVELFTAALQRLCGEAEPTAEQVIIARRRAAIWLEVDRQTNTAQAVAERARTATSADRREAAKADARARRDHLASAVDELRVLRRFEAEAVCTELPEPGNVRYLHGAG